MSQFFLGDNAAIRIISYFISMNLSAAPINAACSSLISPPRVVLDLYDQWRTMEDHSGKWRFTSPTHVVRAFFQALRELEAEGGIAAPMPAMSKIIVF